MKLFWENSERLEAVNFFHEKLNFRRLTDASERSFPVLENLSFSK